MLIYLFFKLLLWFIFLHEGCLTAAGTIKNKFDLKSFPFVKTSLAKDNAS